MKQIVYCCINTYSTTITALSVMPEVKTLCLALLVVINVTEFSVPCFLHTSVFSLSSLQFAFFGLQDSFSFGAGGGRGVTYSCACAALSDKNSILMQTKNSILLLLFCY
jgi:hypothetical protein